MAAETAHNTEAKYQKIQMNWIKVYKEACNSSLFVDLSYKFDIYYDVIYEAEIA